MRKDKASVYINRLFMNSLVGAYKNSFLKAELQVVCLFFRPVVMLKRLGRNAFGASQGSPSNFKRLHERSAYFIVLL